MKNPLRSAFPLNFLFEPGDSLLASLPPPLPITPHHPHNPQTPKIKLYNDKSKAQREGAVVLLSVAG